MTPDVLIVGHVAKDITDDGWRAGGSVLYAATQCRRLGLNTAVVTVCGPDVDPEALVPDVSWMVLRDNTSTTFENQYEGGSRSQRILDQGRPIRVEDIPEAWQGAPIVLLMPVFQDVDLEIVSAFACSATLLGASVQGWLRQLDITRVMPPLETPSAKAWRGVDVVVASEEDLRDPESAGEWSEYVPIVVLTRAEQGTTVWQDGRRSDVAALRVDAIDPTGAGDVFTAAFVVRLQESGDAAEAARFASAAAALAVQGIGTEAIGDREAIEALLRREAA
ncbi:MAG: PfkB family carbohydrate kinase [Dehalococcoidia bacterium]